MPGGFLVIHSAYGRIGQTRCAATITDGGSTQVAHHEVKTDTTGWAPSMDVTLRKIT